MPVLSFGAKRALYCFLASGGDLSRDELTELFSSKKMIRGLIKDLDMGLYLYGDELTPEEEKIYKEITHFLYELLKDKTIKE